MTLTFCRIFNMIVLHGSFVKAAEALSMTPSAVSHAVADAEAAVGFPLFNRTKKGITLTENGKELYVSVLQMIQSEDSLQQKIDQLNGLRQGTVGLGVFNSVCTNWMPEIFERFYSDHPAIQIHIYEGSYDDVIYWLKNGIVELGFLSTTCTTELAVDGRYIDPLVCIVPQDFPNRQPGVITLEEMQDQRFILQREGSDADVQTLFRKYDFKYQTSCQVLDDLSIMTMIACKQGISIMPRLTAKGLDQQVKVLRIIPEEHRQIGLAAIDLRKLSPAAKELYACINHFMDEQMAMGDGAKRPVAIRDLSDI